MDRRSFFKAVTGFVAGVFAGTAKSSEKDLCSGQNGTLCPRCKFNEKRKQKFYTGDRVHVGDLPEYMSHFRGENKDATVLYSNITQDGNGIEGGKRVIYALDIDGFGFNAWYPENLLTRIGKVFYIDYTNGDDKNDGLSWKTAKKNWVEIVRRLS